MISAHTDAPQLKRLIGSLPANAEFFVHIDANSDITQFTGIITDKRVHFLRQREDVCWGAWTQVRYQMALVRAALAAETSFDRLITLSGMDYPIWSNSRILKFFADHPGTEYIQGMKLGNGAYSTTTYQEYRLILRRKWIEGRIGNKLHRMMGRVSRAFYAIGIRKPLYVEVDGRKLQLHKGSSWWAITPRLARVILDMYDDYYSALTRYFHTSFAPDETFPQTIAFNSDFAGRCLLTPKEQVKGLEDLTPLTFIDYSAGIIVLTEKDYDRLLASGKMFCRKMRTGVSGDLPAMLDRHRQQEGQNAKR